MTKLEKYQIAKKVLEEFFNEGNSLSYFTNWIDIKLQSSKTIILEQICTYTGTDCNAKDGNTCMCDNPCQYRKNVK
jgi:hypothetical protein